MLGNIHKITNILPKLVKRNNLILQLANMSTFKEYKFETLNITSPKPFVYHVELNRPNNLNAMSNKMWIEIGEVFHALDTDEDCRVIILSGAGRIFCAGLDFTDNADAFNSRMGEGDLVRRAKALRKVIKTYQNSMTSLEICKKPVISSVHSACIGGAMSLITAADIRYCTEDAWFTVKEIDIGLAADVGVLQRLSKVIKSDSLARELCYTARKMDSKEAETSGLISKVFQNKESMLQEVLKLAEVIASKSPVAVQGTKASLVYSRDHTVQEGLDHICQRNEMALQSDDFSEAILAAVTKKKDVIFAKL